MTDLRKAAEMILDELEHFNKTSKEAYLYDFTNEIAALRQALVQDEHEPVAWTKVSDGLPKSGVTVLACYRNSLGNLRRIRAHWIAAKTEESNGDYDEFFEYDEETDTYYAPEGWYECIDNWGDYSSVRVCEGEVTHWMPLPPAPDEQLRSKNT